MSELEDAARAYAATFDGQHIAPNSAVGRLIGAVRRYDEARARRVADAQAALEAAVQTAERETLDMRSTSTDYVARAIVAQLALGNEIAAIRLAREGGEL